MQRFIHNENIRLYRKLLSEEQDKDKRDVIRRLLAEEDAKDAPKASPTDRDGADPKPS